MSGYECDEREGSIVSGAGANLAIHPPTGADANLAISPASSGEAIAGDNLDVGVGAEPAGQLALRSDAGANELEGAGENADSARAARQRAAASRVAAKQESSSRVGKYVVAGCVAVLVVLTMLGGLLNVGDHLGAAHPALAWVFYLLLAVLVVVGVVVPVVKVARRPIFSLYQLRDEQGHAKQRRCRMIVDNLIANTDLTDEEVLELEGYLSQGDRADDLIIAFFEKHCIPAIDAETKRTATASFFVAAIAHSPLVNTVTMLSLCLDLVRSIVEICGFRPTNVGLVRLYTRVMASALIVGGIEDSDLGDMLGQIMGGGAGARVGGIVMGATAEGLVSAFLVFRVGVITKRWLTAADGPAQMASIRRASYREALAMMRSSDFMQTVADSVKQTSAAVATSVATSVGNAAKSTFDSAKDSARDAAESARDAMRDAAESTRDAARASAESAREAMRDAAESTRDAAESAFDAAIDAAENAREAAESAWSKISTPMKEWFSGTK